MCRPNRTGQEGHGWDVLCADGEGRCRVERGFHGARAASLLGPDTEERSGVWSSFSVRSLGSGPEGRAGQPAGRGGVGALCVFILLSCVLSTLPVRIPRR